MLFISSLPTGADPGFSNRRARKKIMIMCAKREVHIWTGSGVLALHCKNWCVKITPVGVNRGPHPQVLKLHPRV